MAPMEKFLGFWSLRTGSKTMAMVAIIFLGISIFSTRRIPEQFDEDKDWKVWRNLDFSVDVVSLLFVSFLLYGSISEFRLFVLLWIPWNVILEAFWITFLVRKYDEFEEWEKVFRIIAIILMAYAELVAWSYCTALKEEAKDPETGVKWNQNEFNQDYKTLCEQRSYSSLHSVFMSGKVADNVGFHEELDQSRNSLSASEASEVIEMKVREEKKEAEIQAPADSEIAITVHPQKPESAAAELQERPTEMVQNSKTPSQEAEVSITSETGPEVSVDVAESEVSPMTNPAAPAELNAPVDLAMVPTDTTGTQQPVLESSVKDAGGAAKIEDSNTDTQAATASANEEFKPDTGAAPPVEEEARVEQDVLQEDDKNRT